MPNRESDPAVALKLLWEQQTPGRRGPKPALELPRIVATAIELADAHGVATVSMRALATHLGVSAASLYTYVPGKTELVALMLDSVAGDSTPPETFPGGWRDKVEAWAREDWREFHRHPWVPQVASAEVLPGPNLVAWFESALAALEETNLTIEQKVVVVETVDSYVRGVARNSIDATEAQWRSSISKDSWSTRRAEALAQYLNQQDHPEFMSAAAANALGSGESTADSFEFGLGRLLDGIETFVSSRDTAYPEKPLQH